MRFNLKSYKTKNFKGVLSLMAGNTISKLILSLGGFVLADYYGPENYAVYGVFLSYVTILPVLASFRLENIMILQRGSTEIRNIFSVIIWISLFCTCVMVSVLCLLKSLGLVNIDLSCFILLLCGAGALLTAWNNTQNALFTKFKLFKQMSIAFVLASVFSVVFQGIFYFAGWEKDGLIYGWLVGLTASFIYNSSISKDKLNKINIPLFRQSVKEHIEIVKFTYPSDSINIIANNILPILVIGYFTKTEVGVYLMAFKILSTPLLIITSSVSRVYFQKSVMLYNHDRKALWNLTSRVILTNVCAIFIFVILMNTIGVYLLEIFLSDSWRTLDVYILALSVWIIARSAMNPIASLVLILKKNYYSLIFNVYLFIVNIIAIYLGVLKEDFLYCIWIFSILSSIGYFVLLTVLLNNLKKDVKKIY